LKNIKNNKDGQAQTFKINLSELESSKPLGIKAEELGVISEVIKRIMEASPLL